MKHSVKVSFLIVIIASFILSGVASAHALLVRSIPEANAALDRAPAQVELFFGEGIEPAFSSIQVLDSQGKSVTNNDSKVDPNDPTHLTVSLRSLSDGIYTVAWKTISAVDSHVTQGSFPFAVGNVEAAALASAAQASNQITLSIGEVVSKWWLYLSVLALTGSTLFILTVWQPAHRAIGSEVDRKSPLFTRLPSIALIVLITANILALLVQAGQAAGTELGAPWSLATYSVLFTTRFGALWIARSLLALLLAGLFLKNATQRERLIALPVCLLLLLTISLGSHAASEPQPSWPVLADWLHLFAASIWIGGLVHFVAGLWTTRQLDQFDRTRLIAQLLPRFSRLALISVAALVLTGLYSAVLRVGSMAALFNTIYGQALIVKIAIIAPMIMIGAANLLLITPRLKRAVASSSISPLAARFQRMVTSEVTIGAVLLLSVSVFTSLPPARSAATAQELTAQMQVDDLEVALNITPGRIGINTFGVKLTSNGQPVDGAKSVQLRFTSASANIPPSQSQLVGQGGGLYSNIGAYLSLPDIWQVQVAIRRVDKFDSFANFNFDLSATVSAGFAWNRINGVLLLIAALAYLLAFSRRQLPLPGLIAIGRVPAFALALAGLLVLNIQSAVQNNQVNPIPPNAESVTAGQAIYQVKCVPCHGPTGKGDGPIGLTLNPRPADLTLHAVPGVHTDAQLFEWITNGFPNSVMPAWGSVLSDNDRWNLVNFIRTLAPK